MDVISRSATTSSNLNPNAPMFVPLAYRTVEDFSAEWWALVQSSPWFQDYWLQERFQDPQNDAAFPDILDPGLLPDIDAFFDNIHVHHCKPAGNTNIASSPTHVGWRGKSDGDGISLFGARKIWIDHCSLSFCADGLINAIMGSTGITISNNYFAHHDEVMLLGHDDKYLPDSGMQVTIAFNHFGVALVQRMPRCRREYIHVVNNDFTRWEMYAIGGSANPTINSQGSRYTAPQDENAKEVTKRVGTGRGEELHRRIRWLEGGPDHLGFYKITNNMCTDKLPTVGLVLFFMDHISETIAVCRDSHFYPESLKNAAKEMAEEVRGYNSQDRNIIIYMTAILDPRIKGELFPESLNSDNFLDEARTHFIRNYSTTHFPSIAGGYSAQEMEEGCNVSFAEEIARKKRRANMSSATDELTQYLSEPPAPLATDVLEWWKVNSMRYPRLSLMARDFLAVQAVAVAPEELFCGKGDEIYKQRFCMPHGSTQTLLCIRSWLQSGMKMKYKSTEIDFERLMELATSAAAADNSAHGSEKKPKH